MKLAPEIKKPTGTILIVDDEEPLRLMAKALVENMGYKVLMASDGEEAVSIYRLRSSPISAVLLDMTMPKMKGRQVLSAILEIDPKAAVILVSGYTAEGTSEELIQAGAKDFINKPYSFDTLSTALQKVL